jgi:hypothetical protein
MFLPMRRAQLLHSVVINSTQNRRPEEKVTMKDQMRTYAPQLLHAFAEAGSSPPARGVQPLMVPMEP